MKSWVHDNSDVLALLRNTGLHHLCWTMYEFLDMSLICAFIERWQPDTNSFHMPFGEMTITLHDVWYLLKIPVSGNAVWGEEEHDYVKSMVRSLFNESPTYAELEWKRGSGSFKFSMIKGKLLDDSHCSESVASGYLW